MEREAVRGPLLEEEEEEEEAPIPPTPFAEETPPRPVCEEEVGLDEELEEEEAAAPAPVAPPFP